MCEANAAGVKHCKVLNIELFWHVRTSTLRGRPETSTILYMAWPNPAAARVQAGPGVPPGDAPGRRHRLRYGFKMGGGPPLGTRTPDYVNYCCSELSLTPPKKPDLKTSF